MLNFMRLCVSWVPNQLSEKIWNNLKRQKTFQLGTARRTLVDVLVLSVESPSIVDESYPARTASQKNKRYLVISTIAMGFAVAGVLVNPLFGTLSLPGFVYGAFPIYQRTWTSLRKGEVSVDVLSSITILACLGSGYYITMGIASITYSVSRVLLDKVTADSRKSVIDVFQRQPHAVWIVDNGLDVEIPFSKLTIGDTVVVNAGESIPVDGTITAGIALVDQHILTGEGQPVEKEQGDQVFASTIVLSGRIYIQVEQAGDETTVAKIGQILNNTTGFKTATQLRAEKMADRTVWPTLVAGVVALPMIGPMGTAAMFNAHFKHRMNIVAPISVLNYLHIMSQHGILIKNGRMLDLLNEVDTLVFDKTGTLTEEQPHVGAIYTCADYSEMDILRYAAAAEAKQSHPIARAILEAAATAQIVLPPVEEAEYKIGYGLTVTVEHQLVQVGSIRFMALSGIPLPLDMQQIQRHCHQSGHSLVMIACNETLIGAIELLPTVRPEAQQVIHALRQRANIQSTYIISGDHETPTRKLAEALGIDHYFAETLPENKAHLIEQLQAEGKSVCFVGDGINDSIALKKAKVSISLRGASTVATDTAQIVLMNGTLHQLPHLFAIADEFETNVKTGFLTLLVPTLIGMGGVLFFHMNLIGTIILAQTGLAVGVVNAMRPRFQARQKLDNDRPTLSNDASASL